jgi:nitrilase
MVRRNVVLGGRETVKVAIAQVSPVYLDRERSIERACETIRDAAAGGAELVLFPEVWLAGYPYWTEGWDSALPKWVDGRVRFRDAAVVAPSEDTERIGEAVREAGAYVVIGCNELDPRPEANTIYNTLLFFDRDGELLGRHRKLMPTFVERIFWGSGDASDLVVFDTDIGRLGGLVCGEHLMTTVRASLIAQGEDFHVAVFPGSFALHTGPQLEEPDTEGAFWGHASVRAHALEAGAFVLSACGYLDQDDVADDFPYKGAMNDGYAHGGSSIIAPLGVPLAGPEFGSTILYAECHAWMKKAWNAIIDTVGHYARPDVLRLSIRTDDGWRVVDSSYAGQARRDALRRSAERHDVDDALVEELAAELDDRHSGAPAA